MWSNFGHLTSRGCPDSGFCKVRQFIYRRKGMGALQQMHWKPGLFWYRYLPLSTAANRELLMTHTWIKCLISSAICNIFSMYCRGVHWNDFVRSSHMMVCLDIPWHIWHVQDNIEDSGLPTVVYLRHLSPWCRNFLTYNKVRLNSPTNPDYIQSQPSHKLSEA